MPSIKATSLAPWLMHSAWANAWYCPDHNFSKYINYYYINLQNEIGLTDYDYKIGNEET